MRAITQAKEHLSQDGGEVADARNGHSTATSATASDNDDEEDGEEGLTDTETEGAETDISSTVPESELQTQFPSTTAAPPADGAGHRRSINSIAEDVFGKKVPFGRFAASWLSRKTLGFPGFGTVDRDTTEVLLNNNHNSNNTNKAVEGGSEDQVDGSSGENNKEKNHTTESALDEKQEPSLDTGTEGEPSSSSSSSDQTVELLPKLLRYTRLLFSSQNFFFAYDYDLTRQIGTQEPCNGYRPLHTVVDPLVGLPLARLSNKRT